MSKHAETIDQPQGRFDGDALVTLMRHPGAKYPWEVQIYIWREFAEEAHAKGYEDGWRGEHSIFAQTIGEKGFYNKTFKALERAVRYYHKVTAHADIVALQRECQTKYEEAAETVLASVGPEWELS